LNVDEFLEMAKPYKKVPCPVCQEQTLIYAGYIFVEGDMAGQLKMNCNICNNKFEVHVHSLENSEVLQ